MKNLIARIAELEIERDEAFAQKAALEIDLEAANAKLEHLGLYDDLTGLANRRLLSDRFDVALAAALRENQSLLVFVMDLDRFKAINDTLGHQAGDIVLTTVAKRIKHRLRDSDTVARFGGDEFVFLLRLDNGEKNAPKIAKSLIEAVQKPIEVGKTLVNVGSSIGIACCPDAGVDLVALLGCADKAMYEAKQGGLGFYIHDDKNKGQPTRGPRLMANDLRAAIEQEQLELYYQPKIDMRTLKICGVEALARWRHPERGIIMPDDFIPLAERSSLIGPFTSKTVSLAIAQLQLWQDIGVPYSISVNLSPRSLHVLALAEEVIEQLNNWQQLAGSLVFEVTESELMVDADLATRTLTRLASLGSAVSIDDFGTGYSSLSCLNTLPVNELKIDRSFVSNMHTHKENLTIVRSIIDLAHNLDMSVVAEGVETMQDWDTLVELGCDYAQGYYISRPLPVDDLISWSLQWPGSGESAKTESSLCAV